jgi:hypothetical protein
MGVRGDCSGATGATYGVYGQSASATGFGVDGVNTNASGTGLFAIGNNATGSYLVAGSGAAINGNSVAVFGYGRNAASGIGIVGVGNNNAAITTPVTGCGVVGTGNQFGIMGFATSTVNTAGGTDAITNGASASSGGYFEVQAAGVPQTWAYVGVRDNGAVLRKIIGPGTVNTIVKDLNDKLVALSCPETPENLFQDYGTGTLTNGTTHIAIDPILAKNITVNDQHPLKVFIQLEGNCNGVYVTNKTQFGFDVVELNNGTSNVPFSWTLVANRADEINPDGTVAKYSEERFPAAPGPVQSVAQQTAESLTTEILNSTHNEPVQTPGILKKAPSKTR